MNMYIDLLRKWLDDPKSVSDKELSDNYKNAREANPIALPRSLAVWAGLDACFESVFNNNSWYISSVQDCVAKYDKLITENPTLLNKE